MKQKQTRKDGTRKKNNDNMKIEETEIIKSVIS